MSDVQREMFSDEMVEAMERLHMYPRLIAERAAHEAVAAERARIKAGVEGLPSLQFWCSQDADGEGTMDETETVEKVAVLRMIEGETP